MHVSASPAKHILHPEVIMKASLQKAAFTIPVDKKPPTFSRLVAD